MNTFRKQPRDLRKYRLDALAHHYLVVGFYWLIIAFRVLLAAHRKLHPVGFAHCVFRRIIRVAVSINSSLPAGNSMAKTSKPRPSLARPGIKAISTGKPLSV